MLYRVHLACAAFEVTTSVMIGTDCIGSCKSNYHIITTTTAPHKDLRNNKNVTIFYLSLCLVMMTWSSANWKILTGVLMGALVVVFVAVDAVKRYRSVYLVC
jgi:hypothetical protein